MALNKVTYVDGQTVIYAQNLNDIQDEIIANAGEVADLDDEKVDKVPGKQLSTEDYSSAEKSKLAGIQAGAQVNPGNATPTTPGLMSAADKAKLDGIEAQATRVLIDNTLAQSGQAADAKAAGDAIGEVKDSLVTPTETGTTATQAYSVGDYFWRDGALYRAARNIAVGTSFSSTNAVLASAANDLRRIATTVDTQINSLHNLINYGYDNPVDREQSGAPHAVKRNGIRCVLNYDYTASATGTRFVLNHPDVGSFGGTAGNYGSVVLKVGHTYQFRMHHVSGTATNEVLPWVLKLGATGTSNTQNVSTDPTTGDLVNTFTYSEETYPGGVVLVVYVNRRSTGNVLSNYTFDATLEDITNGSEDLVFSDLAPVEAGIATATHAVGDLLVYKHQLYEVTAAIATGETLVPGTNITPTTIAAQLAALRTLINS